MKTLHAFALAATLVGGSASAAPATMPEPLVPIANPFHNVRDLLACTARDGTLVSAHRGGAGPGYPENAIETGAHTLSQFPALLEVDVRRSRDGVLLLMHDATLERTSTGSGPVDAQDWAALQKLHLKDNDGQETSFRIPRLIEMARWAKGRALVLAEVKISDSLPQIIREIREAGAQANIMLLVNSIDDAKRAQALDRDIALTFDISSPAALEEAKAAGVDTKRIIAWTGIGKRDRAFWADLRGRGMVVAYGTLWYVDGAIENLDLKGLYAELARDGVDLMATDRAAVAHAEISAVRPIEPALQRCRASGAPAR